MTEAGPGALSAALHALPDAARDAAPDGVDPVGVDFDPVELCPRGVGQPPDGAEASAPPRPGRRLTLSLRNRQARRILLGDLDDRLERGREASLVVTCAEGGQGGAVLGFRGLLGALCRA
ncbi:hypothetical protein STANM309S_05968 [Streptomyces tanashiensis]